MEDREEEETPTKMCSELEEDESEQPRNGNQCRVEDEHVLQFLDSADDYLILMDSLSLILRQGWFELAGARYSMGVSRLNGSLLDLKPRSALTSIHTANQDEDVSEANFELRKWASFSDTPGKGKSEDASQLRRRGRTFPALEESATQNEALLVNGVDQVQKERLKSLSVFGTLVSPKLRTAQLSFETALDKVVEIANARSKMVAAFHRVKDGMNGSTKL